MAKKVKTPEEVQASIDKKVARRKIFFGTFSKSLALFLAIAMVFSLAYIAFAPAKATAAPAGPSTGLDDPDDDNLLGGDGGNDAQTPNGGNDAQTPGDGDTQTPGDGNDAQNPGTPGTPSTGKMSKADAVKAVNEATAAASKMSYKWSRECKYTKPVEVAMKDTIEGLIKISVDDVVGMFIGIGKDSGTYTAGDKSVKNAEGKEYPNYMLKAMTLTEGDVKAYDVTGDRYRLQLNPCKNPQKDGKNPLHKATNDILTHKETADAMQQALMDALGSAPITLKESTISYSGILVDATIKDGKLQKLTIVDSAVASLGLGLKMVGGTIKGSGAMATEYIYTDFA